MPGQFLNSSAIFLAGLTQPKPIVELYAHIFGMTLMKNYSFKLFDKTFEYLRVESLQD